MSSDDFINYLFNSKTCGSVFQSISDDKSDSFQNHVFDDLYEDNIRDIVSVAFALSTKKISLSNNYRTLNSWWGDYLGMCLMQGGKAQVNRVNNEKQEWIISMVKTVLEFVINIPIGMVVVIPDKVIEIMHDAHITEESIMEQCSFDDLRAKYRSNTYQYLAIHIQKIILLEISSTILFELITQLTSNRSIEFSIHQEAYHTLWNFMDLTQKQISYCLENWSISSI